LCWWWGGARGAVACVEPQGRGISTQKAYGTWPSHIPRARALKAAGYGNNVACGHDGGLVQDGPFDLVEFGKSWRIRESGLLAI
jgi:hypothetical protein